MIVDDKTLKLVDDMTLNKLNTRITNTIRQKENRAKVIEKTRNISENTIEESTNNNNNNNDTVSTSNNLPTKKLRRQSSLLVTNNEKQQHDNNITKQQNNNWQSMNNIKEVNTVTLSTSSSTATIFHKQHNQRLYSNLKENKIFKPVFKVTKIHYDDKHLYQTSNKQV